MSSDITPQQEEEKEEQRERGLQIIAGSGPKWPMWPYLPFTAIALPLPCLACCCCWPLPNARTSVQEQLLCNLDIVWFKSIFAHCNWNMSEKLRLHWNDFQENINVLFGNLRGNGEFSDVTLACEDGQQFEGHKVVLAASSPVFQNLLKMSKLQNH